MTRRDTTTMLAAILTAIDGHLRAGATGYCDACRVAHDDTKGDTTTMNTANDNDHDHDTCAPTMLDTVLAVLAAAQPAYRWALEGWAALATLRAELLALLEDVTTECAALAAGGV